MDISNLLQKARECAERRNYDYAIALYLQACKLAPDSVEARRELRAVEHRVAKERGVSFMGKAKMVAQLGKAKTLLMAKKYDAAMEAAEEALKIDPGNVGAQMALSRAAMGGNYPQTAIAVYEDLHASKCGGNTKAHLVASRELALAYEKAGQIEKALDVWSEVKKLKPDDRDAVIKIRDLSASTMTQKIEAGSAAGGQGGKMAATQGILRDKKQLSRQKGGPVEIHSAEDMQAAIQDAQEAIKQKPEDARLHGKLGDLFKRANSYEEAKLAYTSATEKDAANPLWRFKLDDLESWKKTAAYNALAKKFKAGDASVKQEMVRQRRALLEFQRDSFLEREKQYSTDGRIKFQLGNIFFSLAEVTKESALYDQAIRRFQAIFADPKYRHEAGLKMGLGFARKKQFSLALKRFDESLAGLEIKDNRWKNLVYAKADTLEKSGKRQEAAQAFLQIYELDVAFRDVAQRVEALQKQQLNKPDLPKPA